MEADYTLNNDMDVVEDETDFTFFNFEDDEDENDEPDFTLKDGMNVVVWMPLLNEAVEATIVEAGDTSCTVSFNGNELEVENKYIFKKENWFGYKFENVSEYEHWLPRNFGKLKEKAINHNFDICEAYYAKQVEASKAAGKWDTENEAYCDSFGDYLDYTEYCYIFNAMPEEALKEACKEYGWLFKVEGLLPDPCPGLSGLSDEEYCGLYNKDYELIFFI